jgi:hypothetical protein
MGRNNNFFFEKKLKEKGNRVFECKRNSVKSEYNGVKRIIAIGDVHGDLNILKRCLIKAKVINKALDWIGKNTYVVQVGDILDGGGRGYNNQVNPLEEYQIFDLLNKLDRQASQENGRVIYLIGNHEIMNFMGNFDYVHGNQIINEIYRKQLFGPGGYMARLLACHAYAIIKINNWYFCHAGLIPENLENIENIEQINILTRKILRGELNLENLKQTEKDLIYSNNGIFWNRKYKENNRCDTLKETMKILKTKNGGMIIGHTIIDKNIKSFCNKKLWFTDIGMSSAFGNYNKNVSVLEILNNRTRIIK